MPFIVRRLGFYVVAAWAAVTVNFFIPRAMPGNAVDTMMAKFPLLQPSAQKALEVEFGTGHQGSLFHQYFVYLGDLAHGNLGRRSTCIRRRSRVCSRPRFRGPSRSSARPP